MNIEDLGRGGSGYPNTWVREEVGLEVRGRGGTGNCVFWELGAGELVTRTMSDVETAQA